MFSPIVCPQYLQSHPTQSDCNSTSRWQTPWSSHPRANEAWAEEQEWISVTFASMASSRSRRLNLLSGKAMPQIRFRHLLISLYFLDDGEDLLTCEDSPAPSERESSLSAHFINLAWHGIREWGTRKKSKEAWESRESLITEAYLPH